MKANHIFGIIASLFIILIIALALTNFNQPVVSAQSTGAESTQLQITPLPPEDDISEIGSTDGILFMGVVIVLIVTLPLLFRKKRR
jgi:hypothetical protein